MGFVPKTVVVIPCFNEARRLDPSDYLDASRSNPDLSLLFVNDGSTDGTASLLSGLCEHAPERLHVLHLPANQGKAEAVRLGMLQAFAEGADVAGYFDADLATPLRELPGMLGQFANPEIYAVFGSRVGLLGRRIQRSLLRHYAGRFFATAASSMLGLAVYDTQCGAKLFRNVPGVAEVFARPFSVRWTFDVEILARCLQHSRSGRLAPVESGIVEYPVSEWHDVAGSKLRAGDAFRAIVELLRIWRTYRPRTSQSPPS